MTKWRAKDMPLGERVHFQGLFEEFFRGASGDKRLALFVRSRPGDMKATVLIPPHRSALVETLSPGGWRDYPEAQDEEWTLLVGHDSAFEELGLKPKGVTV